MNPPDALERQVRALDGGRAFLEWRDLRIIAATGLDAPEWLNDLVTAGLADLAAGEARRSLLLSPTGRIRADFQAVRTPEGFLLIQRADQPRAIQDILAPYVLSSDVSLSDRSTELAVYSVPGADVSVGAALVSRPSLLGPGTDLLTTPAEREPLAVALAGRRMVPAEPKAVEVWRIRKGSVRFPVDLDEDSLPAEGGLETVIDLAKGCFLGQESVAKVRNLGHPPRVVLALRAEGPVAPGEAVAAGGRPVGVVTSAAPAASGTAVLARVRWEARSEALATTSGLTLLPP